MKYWNNTTSQWVELASTPYGNSAYSKTIVGFGYIVTGTVNAIIGFDNTTAEYVLFWEEVTAWQKLNDYGGGTFSGTFTLSDTSGAIKTQTVSGSVWADARSAGSNPDNQSSFRFEYGHDSITVAFSGSISVTITGQSYGGSGAKSNTFSYTAGEAGLAHIDNGTAFESCTCHIDNGTSWDQYIPYIDNGTSWEMCS